ncbi:2'-5' RNA ligase family protein [Kitasatospora putterlickiae]|uniref:2'-5' RNA ligase family protein n=1 Tax=Kitasatospora putterlickiae TaxID=221725 RepID=A0ABP4IWQ6_9ACTN
MTQTGESALVLPVPEAEAVVGPWRERYDPSARLGVPAHVTVLYPFLPAHRLDAGVLGDLGELLAAQGAFDLAFTHCGDFPGVHYLAPSAGAAARLNALTAAVAARWPEHPPYGGRFAEVVPHLTVAYHDDPGPVAAGLAPHLPLTARAEAVRLLVFDGARWVRRADFPLSPKEPR